MRISLLVALLFTACASSSGTSPRLGVGISELYGQGQQVTAVREHVYYVTITNHSADTITVNTIHLDAAGTDDYQVESATENEGVAISPDETQQFEVSAFVSLQPNRSRTVNYRLDSLRVTITGTGPAGNFIDSGTYPIALQRGQ